MQTKKNKQKADSVHSKKAAKIKPLTKSVQLKSSEVQGLHEKLRQTEMLLGISRSVAAMETVDEVLEALIALTTKETGAERGTLFLNDVQTGELFSRIAQGSNKREIRLMNSSGVAGHVFTSGESMIIHDAYSDEHFDSSIDEQTEFLTKSILCTPVRTVRGEIIGVAQALNKIEGKFNQQDLKLLEAITTQAAVTLQSTQFVERVKQTREEEMEFLDIVADVTSEIDLSVLLQKVMGEATRLLKAERSTLFLNDDKTNELWSEVGEGLNATQIRLPNNAGIAGTVFTSGLSVNIPHAYADLRFNPSFDKQTGYFTRSILCVPVINKNGKTIGVTQVLNKRGGPFTVQDEQRLKAFTAQVSIGLENAKLFNDVQNMKNYNESMLKSMSNGVITLDEEGKIVTCNAAGLEILRAENDELVGILAVDYFTDSNAWILEKVMKVSESQKSEIAIDTEIECSGRTLSVNLTVLPLVSSEEKKLGTMIMIDDISDEKRMKSTMSRYMDPGIADQLLLGGKEILGGASTVATVLFSDIRGFTELTEELGAQGTVSLLNEYFTIMVECIQNEGGMLDKFIGDAIMAAFGMPVSHDDDEDRAVRAAVSMISGLNSWNLERAENGQLPVNMGIGLNTDTVVSGNIGSPKRMDYTIIGDGVNLAARLESACKQYSTPILISENTYKKLRGTYRSREVDHVVVKGKTKPVAIYEILDYHSDKTFPNVMEVLNQFKSALANYRDGKWDNSISGFKEVLRLNPKDALSQMYVERCSILKKNPPKDWNGIWVMESK